MSKLIPVIVAMVVVGIAFTVFGNPFTSGNTPLPPAPNPSNNTTPVPIGDEPPADRTWISPGRVNVTVGAGATYPVRAEYSVTVHNGNLAPTAFSVRYAEPHYVAEGFSAPPDGAQDWVIIADTRPVLAPRETREILIALVIPTKKDNLPNWEFWIIIGESKEGDFIVAEMAVRWLITTRSK